MTLVFAIAIVSMSTLSVEARRATVSGEQDSSNKGFSLYYKDLNGEMVKDGDYLYGEDGIAKLLLLPGCWNFVIVEN